MFPTDKSPSIPSANSNSIYSNSNENNCPVTSALIFLFHLFSKPFKNLEMLFNIFAKKLLVLPHCLWDETHFFQPSIPISSKTCPHLVFPTFSPFYTQRKPLTSTKLISSYILNMLLLTQPLFPPLFDLTKPYQSDDRLHIFSHWYRCAKKSSLFT